MLHVRRAIFGVSQSYLQVAFHCQYCCNFLLLPNQSVCVVCVCVCVCVLQDREVRPATRARPELPVHQVSPAFPVPLDPEDQQVRSVRRDFQDPLVLADLSDFVDRRDIPDPLGLQVTPAFLDVQVISSPYPIQSI